jgi:hypothetical protein
VHAGDELPVEPGVARRESAVSLREHLVHAPSVARTGDARQRESDTTHPVILGT